VTRRLAVLIPAARLLLGQDPQQPQLPPEEDEREKPKEYAFNPLQAANEIKVGNYYFKRGSYSAALRRFEEATKWDPANPEAFLRLGETFWKLQNGKAAKAAWRKYLQLKPDAKDAAELKKRIDKIKG
jgi:tetratricopeptide (TPR) repeat protein